jgi:hypothetical protein
MNPVLVTTFVSKFSCATVQAYELPPPSPIHLTDGRRKGSSERKRRSWKRNLRRRSAASRLLVLQVRIPPGAWMPVSCECCQVEVSASGWSLFQTSPTECGVWTWSLSREGPGRLVAVAQWKKNTWHFVAALAYRLRLSGPMRTNVAFQRVAVKIIPTITPNIPVKNYTDIFPRRSACKKKF